MKKIPFSVFQSLMSPIEKYQADYSDHADGLTLICKDSHAAPYLGASLLDSYVDLVENYLELDSDWINWFVWEDKYGVNGYEVGCEGIQYKITCLEDLYNFLTKY